MPCMSVITTNFWTLGSQMANHHCTEWKSVGRNGANTAYCPSVVVAYRVVAMKLSRGDPVNAPNFRKMISPDLQL
jgi:hypothetical protein